MKLPLVDEVRAARAAAVEAQRAFQDAARVDAAMRAVDLHSARKDRASLDVPGGVELAEVTAAWPAIAHLAEAPGAATRLAERRGRLQLALEHLRPLGSAMAHHLHALQALQLAQQEALQTPRYRRSAAAIQRRVEQKAALEHELLPFESELVALDLVASMLREWLPRAAADEQGPVVRHHLGEGLRPLIADLPAEVAGAFADRTPTDEPAWAAFEARVAARRADVTRTATALRRRRDRLHDWLAERVG